MLDRHLIVKTSPVAKPENIVTFGDYRVTVLSDRLFRLETSKSHVFRDAATQTVWFRNMPKQEFSVTEKEGKLYIATAAATLVLAKTRRNCRVMLGGKMLPITNEGNLKGTYRTLDNCNGDWDFVQHSSIDDLLDNGVCSKSGVAVFDDSVSLTLGEDGAIKEERADGSDEYIFAFGNDYRAAVQAFYMITGKTPLVPRFALGNWWSRYHAYTQEEYIRLINKFFEREVPITVATVDMDWHWSDTLDQKKGITADGRNTPFYMGEYPYGNLGWTGYSWNTDLFPDYKKFLRDLKKKNLKVTLNIHPATGVRYFEDMYEEMATAMGKDPATGEVVEFDIANDNFVNNYFRILHKPYEEDGVDFWWIDWQQGSVSKKAGLDPLWSLNHYHYYDNAGSHFSPLLLSRYCGSGAHRYPLGFSGDTVISWDTLRYLPAFTANATNIGYTWWSHDIGGHFNGHKENEMFLRHVQYGVFSPINRLHGMGWVITSKEPWMYDNGAGYIVEEFMRLRHRMIPYLYSASKATAEEGLALVEPLYYEWDTPKAYEYRNEYLFGRQLLVIPVTEKCENDGYARIRAWIPEGTWTDIFTGEKYIVPKGGVERTLLRTMDTIPVLARAGAIVPMSRDKGNSVENPEKLDIEVWSGEGSFSLFEDGRAHESTSEVWTHFTTAYQEDGDVCTETLTVKTEGDIAEIPAGRTLRVLFKDVDGEKAVVTVKKNGDVIPMEKYITDCAAAELDFDPTAEYEIAVTFPKVSRLDYLKARMLIAVQHEQCSNEAKFHTHRDLMTRDTVEKFVSFLNSRNMVTTGIREKMEELL